LDRVLVSTDWELKFPRATVQALLRDISSDHTPLLLSFGLSPGSSQPLFRFELGWLTHDDFREVVIDSWRQSCSEISPLEIWQIKIRRLRQFLRGWAKNKTGITRRKKELISKLDVLNKKSKTQALQQWEIDLKQTLKSRLIQLLREEEIKWYQRGKPRSSCMVI